MTYYHISDLFLKLLNHSDSLEKVYTCMQHGDLVELTMKALDVLKETKTLPKFEKKWKDDRQSALLREEGNKAYVAGRYQIALTYYNQALLHAPNRSNSMLLAYSNRSALLHKTKNYSASIKDIDTCLKLQCNNEILEKLTKRKLDCQQNLWKERCRYSLFPGGFFKLDGKRHPQIPCISNDIKIVIDPETRLPKVTAAKDIKVGTVIGVDTAFTTLLNPLNFFICCYYCQKMSLNLMPCSNCTYALFCDTDCKELCMKESHSVECYIMDMLQGGFCGPYSRISFRTVIKIKQMCETWKEFIEASHSIGSERMKNSSVDQIYDGNHKFSMLNFVELRQAKDGAKYNFAFMCATFLENLINLPFFLPNKQEKKNEAIHALARMSMGLLLKFYNKIELNNVIDDRQVQLLKPVVPNNGYFAFASKLRQDCFANILPVGLNNKVGLVALQPIKKGSELTLSYVEHAFDALHTPRYSIHERALELYRFARVCACDACAAGHRADITLNDAQRRQYRRWMTQASDVAAQGTDSGFKPTCEALAALVGLGHTVEHLAVYTKFRSILVVHQFKESRNYGPYDEH